MSKQPDLPTIKELREFFIELKQTLRDDYRSVYADEEDTTPSMDVMIYWGPGKSWRYHTGAVDYFAGDGERPHQAVIEITRRSNSTELAREVRSQLLDQYGQ